VENDRFNLLFLPRCPSFTESWLSEPLMLRWPCARPTAGGKAAPTLAAAADESVRPPLPYGGRMRGRAPLPCKSVRHPGGEATPGGQAVHPPARSPAASSCLPLQAPPGKAVRPPLPYGRQRRGVARMSMHASRWIESNAKIQLITTGIDQLLLD
jgi:hypothetical protein